MVSSMFVDRYFLGVPRLQLQSPLVVWVSVLNVNQQKSIFFLLLDHIDPLPDVASFLAVSSLLYSHHLLLSEFILPSSRFHTHFLHRRLVHNCITGVAMPKPMILSMPKSAPVVLTMPMSSAILMGPSALS